MNQVTTSSFAAVLILGACNAPPEPAVESVEQGLRGGVVVGSEDIVVVDIERSDGSWKSCTGTVITPNVLITSSHCFADPMGDSTEDFVNVAVRQTYDGENWFCLTGPTDDLGYCSQVATQVVRRLQAISPSAGSAYDTWGDFAIIGRFSGWGVDAHHGLYTGPLADAEFAYFGAGYPSSPTGQQILRTGSDVIGFAQDNVFGSYQRGIVGLCGGDSGGPATSLDGYWVFGVAAAVDQIDLRDDCSVPLDSWTIYDRMSTWHVDFINALIDEAFDGEHRFEQTAPDYWESL